MDKVFIANCKECHHRKPENNMVDYPYCNHPMIRTWAIGDREFNTYTNYIDNFPAFCPLTDYKLKMLI